jgi:preprotein translocase subunit SecE
VPEAETRFGPYRGVAQLARAPVSKTGGWGFETLHPCHARAGQPSDRLALRKQDPGRGDWSMSGVAVDPAKFAREVRSEVAKVSWPSRRETLITTALVFAMAALAALFFFVVDQVIGIGVRALFGIGF